MWGARRNRCLHCPPCRAVSYPWRTALGRLSLDEGCSHVGTETPATILPAETPATGAIDIPMARPVVHCRLPAGGRLPVRAGSDRLAVASAVCGLTAVVPVLFQVAGLVLGVASLVRIRRARRCGLELPGRGWAWVGIISSGFVLLSWVSVLGMLLAASGSMANTVEALHAIAPPAN